MKTTTIIEEKEAQELESLLEKEREFFEMLAKRKGLKYANSLDLNEQVEQTEFLGGEITNEMRSKLECYRLANSEPQKYCAYMDEGNTLTTFTGDVIGTFTITNRVKHEGFLSNEKIYFSAMLLNGVKYWGVGYGDGVYCSLNKCKVQPKKVSQNS